MSFLNYIDHCQSFFSKFRLQVGDQVRNLNYKTLYGVSVRDMQFLSKIAPNHESVIQMLGVRAFNENDFPIVQHARCIIEEGDHVIELGAFEGFYSIMLGHVVGSSGRVTACEIMPDSAAVLKLNFKQNQVKGEVIAKGVSPHGGLTKVYCLTGQINGLKPDVIAHYDQNEQMREQELETLSLDQLFEQLNLTQKVKLLILQINGIEFETLQQFSSFDQVENLCFAMKYPKQEQLWTAKEYLASKGMITEFNAYFAYAKHISELKYSEHYQLKRPIYITDQKSGHPDFHEGSLSLPKHVQVALFDLLNQLNTVSKSYQNIDLSIIVNFIQLMNKQYGDDFLTLEEIDLIDYPYELFALIVNKLDLNISKILLIETEESQKRLLAYLFVNLNPTLLKFEISFPLARY